MKKFLLIPDSFKGTMSSQRICELMREQILFVYPDAQVTSIPVADGGEGSVDSFLEALGGKKVHLTVKGPYFEPLTTYYGLIHEGKTAVIEMASCAGLPLVGERRDPSLTTTYGVGELIAHAARSGCKQIIVGLGGSATNDGGVGAACAVGITFYNQAGESFVPTGATLSEIASIDTSGRLPELAEVEILAMCDIDNPLYGQEGAAYVFAPQKGADATMVEFLDQQLRTLSQLVQEQLKLEAHDVPGAGAAGGMGFGMLAFFDATLQMGIDIVLDTVNFEELAQESDLILTGEGKLDRQSLRGKVVLGIARRAQQFNTPVVAIVGDIGDDIQQVYQEGVWAVFSINRVAKEYRELIERAPQDLALTVANLLHFLQRLGW